MRILFLGSGAFGLPTLKRLGEHHTLVGVVSQPDRPAGRGRVPTPTPVAAWATEFLPGIPLLKPERIGEPDVVRSIRTLAGPGFADAWIVIAFGQKLPPRLLDDIDAFNLHASLLPRWRGAAPIQAAILAGDNTTGNSVITLADRMDAGQVLAQSTRPILPSHTAGDLHDLLAADGPELVESVLRCLASGTRKPEAQDESAVTLAAKLRKPDGVIDFASSEPCRRRIHAFNPWPAVTVEFRARPLKLLRAVSRPAPDTSPRADAPGVGALLDADSGMVVCRDGTILQLVEVQPDGRSPMPWPDFARGQRPPLIPGEKFRTPAPPC
ncbi:MAG: methionyl-tRNA formyltransferase [Phycisphaerae bacterium]|nr:methionyl-tRNA formyltransferase [Phycisphaerae bacterium]